MIDGHKREVEHVEHIVIIALRVLVELPAALFIALHDRALLFRVYVNEVCRLDEPVGRPRRVVQRQGEIERLGFRQKPHAVIGKDIYLAGEVDILRGALAPP